VKEISSRTWVRLALVFVGTLGVAIAITGMFIALPGPSVGGTCGPGRGSEAAIVALVNPGSIGAGTEPPASNAEGRTEWTAFVAECQSSADGRILGALCLLVASVGIALLGLLVGRRKDPPSPSPSTYPALPQSQFL
jgi:hypothetical protein